MGHYVILSSFTDQGVKNLKDSPKRVEAFRKMVESAGGKLVLSLYTMGPHDFMAVVEIPSDEKLNEIVLKTAAAGNVRTLTLKAWTVEEFASIAAKL